MRHLVLLTQPDMVTAQRMYAKAGFARLADRDWSPEPGNLLLAYGLPLTLSRLRRRLRLSEPPRPRARPPRPLRPRPGPPG